VTAMSSHSPVFDAVDALEYRVTALKRCGRSEIILLLFAHQLLYFSNDITGEEVHLNRHVLCLFRINGSGNR
jgi:hypothetical protein